MEDINNFRINGHKLQPVKKTSNKKNKLIRGEFLKGPIPISWLLPSLKSDTTTRMALVVFHLYSLNRSPDKFKFSYKKARLFGLHRSTAWRSLKKMQENNQINIVEQKQGCSPVISIIFETEVGRKQ